MATHHTIPSCDVLHHLLRKRIQAPGQEAVIDAEIRHTFEREKTIFVLDMSGFSRIVLKYGIIHYLAMIQRMREVTAPAIQNAGGMVIKFEADNCFAVFDEPTQAIVAIRAIKKELAALNAETPDESDVYVSIGVGHGSILLACDDMYGNELNLASKLGEDVAEKDEVLFTDAARARVSSDIAAFEAIPILVSGVEIHAHRLK